MNRRMSLYLAALVGLVWLATPGWAQVERGRFDVNVGGGVMLHQNASALKSASPLVEMKGRAFLNDNIGFGFVVGFSRTETDDDVFPLTQFDYGTADSVQLVALRQPVALFNYEAIVTLGAPVGESLYPYLMGGIGGYSVYLDPQQNDRPTRLSDLAFSFGGALKLHVSGSSAIELSVRDVIYTDYDRSRLNPAPDRVCRASTEKQFSGQVCPNEIFPFLDPAPVADKSTIHNLVLGASFSFFPRL